jgi:hypothetical protein
MIIEVEARNAHGIDHRYQVHVDRRRDPRFWRTYVRVESDSIDACIPECWRSVSGRPAMKVIAKLRRQGKW